MALVNLIQKIRPAPLQVFLLNLTGANRRRPMQQNGLYFFADPSSNLGQRISMGEMEPELIELLHKNLAPGQVFLDLGANEGFFSVIASKLVGPSGRVVAIEPQSRLGPIILRNLTLNACMNCILVQCVVSDHNGKARLNLSPINNTGSTSLFRVQKYPVKYEMVPSFTLEDLLARLAIPHFDFVKVDVEGSEYNLFMAAKEVLERGILRRIALEIHTRALAKWGFSENLLHHQFLNCGYTVEAEYPRANENLRVYRCEP